MASSGEKAVSSHTDDKDRIEHSAERAGTYSQAREIDRTLAGRTANSTYVDDTTRRTQELQDDDIVSERKSIPPRLSKCWTYKTGKGGEPSLSSLSVDHP